MIFFLILMIQKPLAWAFYKVYVHPYIFWYHITTVLQNWLIQSSLLIAYTSHKTLNN